MGKLGVSSLASQAQGLLQGCRVVPPQLDVAAAARGQGPIFSRQRLQSEVFHRRQIGAYSVQKVIKPFADMQTA